MSDRTAMLPLPKLGALEQRRLEQLLIRPYSDIPGAVQQDEAGLLSIAEEHRADVDNHIRGRLEEFWVRQIPWIEASMPLDGAQVLEIGVGTGSSTVGLSLRGAQVDGVDIDIASLEVARTRCELYGITNVNLFALNATEIDKIFKHYDLILFFASYEHMTHAERKTALRKAWAKLKPGGVLGFIECPNRLWFFDPHTTFRNFFNWLPDELAMDYACFYDRARFADTFRDGSHDAAALEKLARWGRGASYQDLEIVLGPASSLDVEPGLHDFLRTRDEELDRWWSDSSDGRYRNLLMGLEPQVPGAFFYPWLDVLIRKPVQC